MKNEDILNLMDRIDPALVEEAERLSPKKRRPRLRVAVIAACVCLALLGSAFAAEVTGLGVRIANFFSGGETPGHYDVLLDGVEGIPLDSLPEDILAAIPMHPIIDFPSVAEAGEALGTELTGFAPFEIGATKAQMHISVNNSPVHDTYCAILPSLSLEGTLDFIKVRAQYFTYLPYSARLPENRIDFTVSAYVFTEQGSDLYNTLPFMQYTDRTKLELEIFTAPDGQEIPIISDTHPSIQYDENWTPVDTNEVNYVCAYCIQDGILYVVNVWRGGQNVTPEELVPALKRVLSGDNA